MKEKEIITALEKLSSEFKTKVSEHFKSNDAIVHLKNLDFNIERINNDKPAALSKNSITFNLKCSINSQGQVVCE